MELNEELVALVTQKVLETLRAGEAAPAAPRTDGLSMTVRDGEEAKPGVTPDEVVIGVAPAFALSQVKTIAACPMRRAAGAERRHRGGRAARPVCPLPRHLGRVLHRPAGR